MFLVYLGGHDLLKNLFETALVSKVIVVHIFN